MSITIPTWNRGALLAERTLPSVLKQTYRRFEVIVVGDGCTDDTETRLAGLGDPRIHFTNLPERGHYPEDPFKRWLVAGTVPANKALELSRGRWIAFLDDDDTLEPDHIEALLSEVLKAKAEFVYGVGLLERSPGQWLRIGGFPPLPGRVLHSAVLYDCFLKSFRYRLDSWRWSLGADALLWLRMHRAGVRITHLDRVVSQSPLRPGQQSQGQQAAKRLRAAWVGKRPAPGGKTA